MDSRLRKDALMDEVRILQTIQHPHIIKIADVFETETDLFLILELVSGGDLFDRIVSKSFYKEDEAKILFGKLVEAVAYLHSTGIAHRDLKPENILLATKDDDTNIKVSDFGLSKVVGEDQLMKTLCGTPQYLAPEIINKKDGKTIGYSKVVDIWSMGVILYILLVGYPPFDSQDTEAMRTAKYSFKHRKWNNVSQDAKDLISHMIVVDPLKRYTIEDTINHPWFTKKQTQPTAISTPVSTTTPATTAANPIVISSDDEIKPNSGKKRPRETNESDGIEKAAKIDENSDVKTK